MEVCALLTSKDFFFSLQSVQINTHLNRGRIERTGEEGLFPSNFVEEQGKPASSVTDGPTYTLSLSFLFYFFFLTSLPHSFQFCLLIRIINARYKSLYDYDAEDNTEISIKEGIIEGVQCN